MNRFVLAGGYPDRVPDGGSAFARELVAGLDEGAHILICAFARPIELWKGTLEKDRQFFTAMLPARNFSIELATPAEFIGQLARADVVYFRGGSTDRLLQMLKEIHGWQNALNKQTIGGTSAGVNFLARYYYDFSAESPIRVGLGILPVKTVVHYKSNHYGSNTDWRNVYQELESYGETLPILALQEGEFTVYGKSVKR